MMIRTNKMSIGMGDVANRAIKLLRMTGVAIFAVAVLDGCVKDELHNTAHPDRGAIKITTDWSGHSSDAVLPASHILRIGSEEQMVSSETNVFNSLFLPGRQDLLVYHQAEGFTIDGTTAHVELLTDGTLNPMPDYLFSAAKELNIVADDTQKVTVTMLQHIRSLILILNPNPDDEERIAGIEASLTGIASSVDLATGSVVAEMGGVVAPVFIWGTDNVENQTAGKPILSASLRLLGVMTGEKQLLSLSVSLTNGVVQTIVTDMTEALKNFDSGEMKPLILDATLTLPAESDMSATISDWNEVNNGDITIN